MICNLNLRTLCAVVAAVALLHTATVSTHAQVTGGTISGTVTDSSGRVVANVRISINHVATGVSREVTTNDEGFYSAPNLLPGTYEMKFFKQGTFEIFPTLCRCAAPQLIPQRVS